MNKNSNHVSGSFDSDMNYVNKNNYINVHIKTIDSIMKKYNHKRKIYNKMFHSYLSRMESSW